MKICSKELTKDDLYKTRVLNKFSLLPTKLTDGSVIWLEEYKVKQQVYESAVLVDYYHNPIYWWIDIEKFI